MMPMKRLIGPKNNRIRKDCNGPCHRVDIDPRTLKITGGGKSPFEYGNRGKSPFEWACEFGQYQRTKSVALTLKKILVLLGGK